jgi:hypothetical protein
MLLDAVDQLIENKSYTGALEYLSQIKDLGISDFNSQTDEKLSALTAGAFEADDLDTAVKATSMLSDTSLLDEELAANIDEALEKQREWEERLAKERQTEEAYTELETMRIRDEEEIQRAEELFSIIPEDYKNTAQYKKIFDFYKPYLGTYYSVEYSSVTRNLRITTIHDKPWTVFIGDVGESGAAFEYPSLTATNKHSSNNYTTWTIKSTNKITIVQVRPSKTFYGTYTR